MRTFFVKKVVRESALVTTIRFGPDLARDLHAPDFPYEPGQWLSVRFPASGMPGTVRRFPLSSSPDESDLAVTVKAVDEYTNSIDLVRPGQPIEVSRPHGRFALPPEGDLVLVAGGIGIAPFLSMLGSIAASGTDRRVLLLWGARTRDDLVARDRIRFFEESIPNFRLIPSLTHDPLWTGERGRLDREKLERIVSGFFAEPPKRRRVPAGFEEGPLAAERGTGESGWNSRFYLVSAPAGMRRSIVRCLKSLGVKGRMIRSETH
jgi:ferredoxin-NADP reductase